MKLFDRQAAASYALKYVFDYNPEWPSYTGHGGDCTNFVSQALYAGGWTMVHGGTILGDERAATSWYSGKAGSGVHDRSRTWAAAANFTEYLQWGGRARRCDRRELALGDVVQLRDYGIIHHTMIVTGVLPDSLKRNIAFVSYHTNDVASKPLTAISTEDMLCWKILDHFDEEEHYSLPRAG